MHVRRVGLWGMLAIGLLASAAQAVILPDGSWEFTNAPAVDWAGTTQVAQNGGTGYDGDPAGGGGGGLQGDGTAIFVDHSSSGGNHAFVTPQIVGDFTVDIRLGALEATGPNATSRMAGISHSAGTKRGLKIKPGEEGGNSLWFAVIAGGELSYFNVPKTRDDTTLHAIRMTIFNTGTQVFMDMWDLESTDAGGWVYLGRSVDLGYGVTGGYPPNPWPAGEVGLGSHSGSVTTQGKILVDYMRVKLGLLGAGDEAISPEPSALLLLAMGAGAWVVRRRRPGA